MPLIPFPELGICLAHVEDTAAGIVLALDKGRPGETYVIAGPADDDARGGRHRRRGQRQEGAQARRADRV